MYAELTRLYLEVPSLVLWSDEVLSWWGQLLQMLWIFLWVARFSPAHVEATFVVNSFHILNWQSEGGQRSRGKMRLPKPEEMKAKKEWKSRSSNYYFTCCLLDNNVWGLSSCETNWTARRTTYREMIFVLQTKTGFRKLSPASPHQGLFFSDEQFIVLVRKISPLMYRRNKDALCFLNSADCTLQ